MKSQTISVWESRLVKYFVPCKARFWNTQTVDLNKNPQVHPWKINMDHKHGGLVGRSFSFLFMGDGCRFQPFIFQGVCCVCFFSLVPPRTMRAEASEFVPKAGFFSCGEGKSLRSL